DLDAALLADDALVLHALVLAAQALVILHGPEDARAEQPVALRLEGAVVDRLGLLHLAMRPAQDLVGTCERDLDPVEGGDVLRLEDIHQLLIYLRAFLCDTKTCVVGRRSRRITASARSPAPH